MAAGPVADSVQFNGELVMRWLTALERCSRWFGWPLHSKRRERRRVPRFSDSPCSMTVAVQGDPWPATMRSLSTDGIGMLVSRPFEPGTRVNVTLMNEQKRITRTLPLEVAYSLEHPNGCWVLGGTFGRKLSGTDLHALLS